jgi:amidohydrolase
MTAIRMAVDLEQIKQNAEAMSDALIETRRTLHRNPELGFREFETTKLIKNRLDALGIPYKSEIAKTGIVATIEGSNSGKTLLIRADMDALPMQEDSDTEYRSQNDEVMHACGHDAHVTCLLGAAEILINSKDLFPGTIKLVFQPAEEGSREYDPTGKIAGGAKPMIIEGAVGDPENPEIDAALALHIVAGDEEESLVGRIGVGDGPFTGSADEFYVTVKGKGGHASAPHSAIDPVYIASQIYIAIQGYLSRTIDPMEPVVFTFGKIVGGFRQNIISETCRMEGTLRTLNEEIRAKLKDELPELMKGIAHTFGGDAEVEIFTGYPVGNNDKKMNDHIRKVTKQMYGDESIVEVNAQLGAEDYYEFGFKNSIPISMFWLGGGNRERGMIHGNHSNFFDFDEKALPIGTSILAATAISYLNSQE